MKTRLSLVESTEFTETAQHCIHCDDGILWRDTHELVCDSCAAVIGNDNSPKQSVSMWDQFQQNRPKHSSGHYKFVGGFGSTYEWTQSEDGVIDPDSFYK